MYENCIVVDDAGIFVHKAPFGVFNKRIETPLSCTSNTRPMLVFDALDVFFSFILSERVTE